jgi:UDP-N-acetyl-alpha-D-quinovosamine dehydrogenase
MKKILVTGANGFVGDALCKTLRDRQVDFLPVVRRATHESHCGIGDLDGSTRWETALDGCDAVIHLAARVHVMDEQSADPLAAFRAVNVDATLNLARQAALHGVKRFVFVSSVKVNGESTSGKPFTAFDRSAPLDPYGQSKLEAEIGLMMLMRATGMEVVIVRPPLVYGPGVGANFLKLMKLVKRGWPLPLGAVHNRRSMVSVENLVDLLITCCRHPDAAGQTFMVSDGQDISIEALLRMLAKAMGRRAWLFPVPTVALAGAAAMLGKSAEADRLLGSLQVDITHTRTTLGWKPPVAMTDSVNKTVAHFLAHC